MWSTLSSSLLKHGKVYWYISLVDSTAFFFCLVLFFQQVNSGDYCLPPIAGSSEAERYGTAGCA